MQAGDLAVPGDRHVHLLASTDAQRLPFVARDEEPKHALTVPEREERSARALDLEQISQLARRERMTSEWVAGSVGFNRHDTCPHDPPRPRAPRRKRRGGCQVHSRHGTLQPRLPVRSRGPRPMTYPLSTARPFLAIVESSRSLRQRYRAPPHAT